MNLGRLLGGAIAMLGAGMLGAGLFGFVATAIRDEPPTEPAPMSVAPGDPSGELAASCASWRQSLEGERDPARRGALHAARPVFCAPEKPGKHR